jgi:molybdopterin synthase sulfur carrier subunit
MKVNIPSPLRSYTDNKSVVEGKGGTLNDVLRNLDRSYAGIVFRILDEQDRIRQHIKFYVNKDPATDLKMRIKEEDTLHIICALSGG